MRKLLILIILIPLTTFSRDLTKIREVLKIVETNNMQYAIGDGGKAFGVLQIHKICVDDVNRVYGTNYIHEQMFEKTCAEEIFSLYLQHGIKIFKNKHKRNPTEEEIVRSWNGGIYTGYKRESTIKYYVKYLKVKKRIEQLPVYEPRKMNWEY